MGKKKATTVNLSPDAQLIKEDLAPVYGLKNILSVGLILLAQLSDTEQKAMIKRLSESVGSGVVEDELSAGRVLSKRKHKKKVGEAS